MATARNLPNNPQIVSAHELEKAHQTIEQQGKAITKLSEENRKLKNQLKWRNDLDRVPAKVMSQNQKAALSRVVKEAQSREPAPDGWILLDKTDELAEDAGMSVKTLQRHLTYCKDLGTIDKKIERVRDKDTEMVVATNTYIKETELTPYPRQYKAQEERNHGGTRLRCKCGSERIEKRVTYICTDCGECYDKKPEYLPPFDPNDPQDQFGFTDPEHECEHETEFADSDIDSEPQDQFGFTAQESEDIDPQDQIGLTEDESRKPNLTLLSNNYLSDQVVLMDRDESIKQPPPASFPSADSIIKDWLNQRRGTDHIIVSTGKVEDPRGKYVYAEQGYQPDLDAYLRSDGDHIYGSRLRNAETGLTNVLCFEIDEPEQDEEAANYILDLARAGAAPVYWQRYANGRQRGHLELYFDQPVEPDAARLWAIEICPDLEDISEVFPCKEPEDKRNQALSWPLYQRIGDTVYPCNAIYMLPEPHPGGLQEYGLADIEPLADVIRIAVTPAALVEEYSKRANELVDEQEREQDEKRGGGGFNGQKPSPTTQVSYDQDLAKQVTAVQNNLHSWDEIAAIAGGWDNGFFKAVWRNERTASVRPDKDGNLACDYGNHGSYPKKLDKYEAYCLALGIDKRADLAERCAQLRRAQMKVVDSDPPTDEGWPERCPECGDMHFWSHEADTLLYELKGNEIFNLRSGTFYCAEYLSLPDFYSIIEDDLMDQAASSYQMAVEALKQKLAEVSQ